MMSLVPSSRYFFFGLCIWCILLIEDSVEKFWIGNSFLGVLATRCSALEQETKHTEHVLRLVYLNTEVLIALARGLFIPFRFVPSMSMAPDLLLIPLQFFCSLQTLQSVQLIAPLSPKLRVLDATLISLANYHELLQSELVH